MRIDSHQHFWALERGDYGWLTPELAPLYRDFLPNDLVPALRVNGVDGTILVQAAPTVAETQYLLNLAEVHAFVLGVIGWADFEATDASAQITQLATHPKLVGLRPMIQDIDSIDWMLSDTLAPAFDAMIAEELVFDALVLPKHLPNLQVLMAKHPALSVVIDHGAKPNIAAGQFDAWAADMASLAKDTSACVKLSGLVTEAGDDWTVHKLRPYVDHLLTHFGPMRLIWGSDWPVCKLACRYDTWCAATDQFLGGLEVPARKAILGGNAARVYRLKGAI